MGAVSKPVSQGQYAGNSSTVSGKPSVGVPEAKEEVADGGGIFDNSSTLDKKSTLGKDFSSVPCVTEDVGVWNDTVIVQDLRNGKVLSV